MKRLLVIGFILVSGLALGRVVAASPISYPVAQLDNCSNQQSCFNFCDQAQNHATCWSYQTYVMTNSRVLAAETASPEARLQALGITFPIAALGNCASASDCKVYCNQPQNQTACSNFAAQYHLGQNPTPAIMPNPTTLLSDAQKFLGCSNLASCKAFCDDTGNQSKCEEFAAQERMGQRTTTKLPTSFSQALFAAAKVELGCSSDTTCQTFCQQTTNLAKCLAFAMKHQLLAIPAPILVQPLVATTSGIGPMPNLPPGTCSTATECYQYCHAHPEACPGFPKQQTTPPVPVTNPYPSTSGGYTYPSTTYPSATYPQTQGQ